MQTQAQFVSPLGPASTRTTRPSSLSSPARSPPAWPGSARPTLRPASARSPRGPAPRSPQPVSDPTARARSTPASPVSPADRLAPHVRVSTFLRAFLAQVTGRGEISGHEPAALPSLLPRRDPRPTLHKRRPAPWKPIFASTAPPEP